MARLRRLLAVPSSHVASNRSTSWDVRRAGAQHASIAVG